MINLDADYRDGRDRNPAAPLTHSYSYSTDGGANWTAVPAAGAVAGIGAITKECETPEFTFVGADVELTCENAGGFWTSAAHDGLLDGAGEVMIKIEKGNTATSSYVIVVFGYIARDTLERVDSHRCTFVVRGLLNMLGSLLANYYTASKVVAQSDGSVPPPGVWHAFDITQGYPYKFMGFLTLYYYTGTTWTNGLFKLEFRADDFMLRWNNGPWTSARAGGVIYLYDATGDNGLAVAVEHQYDQPSDSYVPASGATTGPVLTQDVVQWLKVTVTGDGVPEFIYEPPAMMEIADVATALASMVTLNIDDVEQIPVIIPDVNIMQKKWNGPDQEYIKFLYGLPDGKFLVTIVDGDQAGVWLMAVGINTDDATRPFVEIESLTALNMNNVVAAQWHASASRLVVLEVINGDNPWNKTWTDGTNILMKVYESDYDTVVDSYNLKHSTAAWDTYVAVRSFASEDQFNFYVGMRFTITGVYEWCAMHFTLTHGVGLTWEDMSGLTPISGVSGGSTYAWLGPWCGSIIPYADSDDRRYAMAMTYATLVTGTRTGVSRIYLWSCNEADILHEMFSYSGDTPVCVGDTSHHLVIAECATHLALLETTDGSPDTGLGDRIRANIGIAKAAVDIDLTNNNGVMAYKLDQDMENSRVLTATRVRAAGSGRETAQFTSEEEYEPGAGNGALFPIDYLDANEYNGLAVGASLWGHSLNYNRLTRIARFYNSRGRINWAAVEGDRRFYALATDESLFIINTDPVEGGYAVRQPAQLNEPDRDDGTCREMIEEIARAANVRMMQSEHSQTITYLSKDTVPDIVGVIGRDQYRYAETWQYYLPYRAAEVNGVLRTNFSGVSPSEVLSVNVPWLHPDNCESLAQFIADNLVQSDRVYAINTDWLLEYEPGDCIALEVADDDGVSVYKKCLVLGAITDEGSRVHQLILLELEDVDDVTTIDPVAASAIDILTLKDLGFTGALGEYIILRMRTDCTARYYLKVTTAGSIYYLYFDAHLGVGVYAISTASMGADLTATGMYLGICDEGGVRWTGSDSITTAKAYAGARSAYFLLSNNGLYAWPDPITKLYLGTKNFKFRFALWVHQTFSGSIWLTDFGGGSEDPAYIYFTYGYWGGYTGKFRFYAPGTLNTVDYWWAPDGGGMPVDQWVVFELERDGAAMKMRQAGNLLTANETAAAGTKNLGNAATGELTTPWRIGVEGVNPPQYYDALYLEIDGEVIFNNGCENIANVSIE